jgi:hypothetical protein
MKWTKLSPEVKGVFLLKLTTIPFQHGFSGFLMFQGLLE